MHCFYLDFLRRQTVQCLPLLIEMNGILLDSVPAIILIFDYDKLQDTATYSNSNSITEGIDSVYVNGVLVYKDKQFTGAAPGKMLRHNA